MRYISLDQVQISPERQRKNFPPAHITALADSILSKGLLHPVVLSLSEGTYTLVAGECRTRAIKELYSQGKTFDCDGREVENGALPYVLIGDLSLADIAEAELEENLLRANLGWQETVLARNLILELRKSQEAGISRRAVAKEISETSGKSLEVEDVTLRKAELVAPHLSNPKVSSAKTLNEAFRIVLDQTSAEARAKLAKLSRVESPHTIILGDCRQVLKTLPPGTFDLIVSDPPYGMKADDMKKSSHHHYDDSPENALEITKAIISQGWKLCKPRALAFIFCDVDHFITLREFAKAQAWSPWRTPLIWQKGEDGFAPWGQLGFSRTYEFILFLSKGEKGLKGGGADIKTFKRPGRSERAHAAEKPVPLLEHLLTIAGDRGDHVLDPCCGSGPIFDAATNLQFRATGIELDPEYHARAQARLAPKTYEEPEGFDEDLEVETSELLE